MEIRPYTSEDKEAVLDLLDLNTPKYFDPSEKEDLIHYLNKEVEDYFVVVDQNQIIAAGGINYFPKEKIARISWDFVSPHSQGKGIGTKLTEYRIQHINNKHHIDFIVVRTTQLVYKFYEKMNFELQKVTKNFWADGYDLYEMMQDNVTS